jgi:hypothetical protein
MVFERKARENDDFSEIYKEKEQIAVPKINQATRKSPGHIICVLASGLIMLTEDPPMSYKIEFALELVNWFLNGRLVKMIIFPKFIYKMKKSRCKKNVTRKSPGHITCVRALSLIIFTEDPPKLYKIEFATILVGWFFNS